MSDTKARPGQALHGSFYMVGTAIMFASAFVATKYTVDTVAPSLAAALRFAVAAVALASFATVQSRVATNAHERVQLLPTDRWRIVLLGVLGIFAYHALFFWALQFTSASLSALIVPTTLPLATAVLARAMLGERLGPYAGAGIAIATVGVLLAIGQAPDVSAETIAAAGTSLPALAGPAALLLAVVCFAAYSVIGYGPVARLGALRTTTYATCVGAVLLALVALPEWGSLPEVPAGAWAAIVFMGVGSSGLGLVWHYRGSALLGPGRAAGFLYLVPLFAVSGSVVLLGESVGTWQLVGGACIVLGVILVQRRKRPPVDQKLVRAVGGKR